MKIYSIGFEHRTLQELTNDLAKNKIVKLVDVRCFPEADSAGYAKGSNLDKSLKGILTYRHLDILAPTPQLLKDYFEHGLPWTEYEKSYLSLLESRRVEKEIDPAIFNDPCCLLCLEHDPSKCHRRIALEYLHQSWGNLEMVHL